MMMAYMVHPQKLLLKSERERERKRKKIKELFLRSSSS